MLSLEEAIAHCLEVADEQEDFDKFQCDYRKLGNEDGVWKRTCRLPSNIPAGWSWGECSESNCPLFSNCLECAKEHRQLAEWLRTLKAYGEARKVIEGTIEELKKSGDDTYIKGLELAEQIIHELVDEEEYE